MIATFTERQIQIRGNLQLAGYHGVNGGKITEFLLALNRNMIDRKIAVTTGQCKIGTPTAYIGIQYQGDSRSCGNTRTISPAITSFGKHKED